MISILRLLGWIVCRSLVSKLLNGCLGNCKLLLEVFLPGALKVGGGLRPPPCLIRSPKEGQICWEIGMMLKLHLVMAERSVSSLLVVLIEKPEE